VRRFITTGAPGSGKSATLALLAGSAQVVREAATDVNEAMSAAGIARPEVDPGFLSRIVSVQRERRLAVVAELQLHDRSVFCTLALARFLGLGAPRALDEELRATRGWFEPRVFFFEPLGFITSTPVRRITYADALRFGEVHRAVYQEHGFDLVRVPAAPPAARAALICSLISS
jgi:predicted ATPase